LNLSSYARKQPLRNVEIYRVQTFPPVFFWDTPYAVPNKSIKLKCRAYAVHWTPCERPCWPCHRKDSSVAWYFRRLLPPLGPSADLSTHNHVTRNSNGKTYG